MPEHVYKSIEITGSSTVGVEDAIHKAITKASKSLHSLRWFQVVTLFNPLTYVSEGMRATLTTLPHLGGGWIALGIGAGLVLFAVLGLRGFGRRAVD